MADEEKQKTEQKDEKEIVDETPKENTEKNTQENKSKETEKKEKKVEKPKKTEAVVNAISVPISTKTSSAICKFIRGKKIGDAVSYLELVARGKKAIPMKGEIPHRKGKRMMSGRFPKNASQYFIILLKSLNANATYNGLNDAVISEAVSNKASRPFGSGGRVRHKRTHITLKCREIKEKEMKKTKENKSKGKIKNKEKK